MKVLIIDGSGKNLGGGKEIGEFCSAYAKELTDRGADVKLYRLRDLTIKQCTGCCACMYQTPGICAIRDDQEKMLRDWIRADIAVIAAPLCRGFINSTVKRFIDRLFPLELPFLEIKDGRMHHRLRYSRYPKLRFILHPGSDSTENAIEANKQYAKLVGDYYSGLRFCVTTLRGAEDLADETVCAERLA